MLAVDSAIDQIAAWDGRKRHEDLSPGQYFKVLTRSHARTGNEDMFEVWRRLGFEASILSQNKAAQQSEISRELLSAELSAIDRSFTDIVKRLVTNANSVFNGELHGGPMAYVFGDTPIRWPGENSEALKVIRALAASMYQVPRLRCNSFDTGIPRNAGTAIAMPLYRQKARIMTIHFGIEIQGRISPDESDAIFRDNDVLPPLNASLRDVHDPPEVAAAEDARAMGTEHAPTPTDEALKRVKAGIDVWTWVPSEPQWVTFDRILQKMNPEGPVDQPGPIFPFSPTEIAGAESGSPTPVTAVGGTLTQ